MPETNVRYRVSSVPGASSYNWTVTGGAQVRSGQGTRSVRIRFNTATSTNVTVTVRAISACGQQSPPRSMNVSVNMLCRTAQDEEQIVVIPAELSLDQVAAYPNPTHGRATISFEANRAMQVSLLVTDLMGRMIMQEQVAGVEGVNQQEINLSDVRAGIYLVKLTTDEGESKTLRLIVE